MSLRAWSTQRPSPRSPVADVSESQTTPVRPSPRPRRAMEIADEYGYTEINLNCGCPSDRVAGAGCFGAALMTDPERVGRTVSAMAGASRSPVTVKCRVGVDDHDSYTELRRFVSTIHELSGCRQFILHARKAWLSGLNPQQNRTIPPLKHEWVFSLLKDFPDLDFHLNGGIMSCYQAAEALSIEVEGRRLAGVMIGRAAYNTPWQCLADADRVLYGEPNPMPSRRVLLEVCCPAPCPAEECSSCPCQPMSTQVTPSLFLCGDVVPALSQDILFPVGRLQEYCRYGDSIIGRFGEGDSGNKYPNVRTIVKPLLHLFHGDKGNK